MKRTQSMTRATLSAMAALMLPEEPSPRLDTVNGLFMKTAPNRFRTSDSTALWATAVWGSKPASDTSKSPGLTGR
jgi:hypothetical protein